jgi:hypothetical protein
MEKMRFRSFFMLITLIYSFLIAGPAGPSENEGTTNQPTLIARTSEARSSTGPAAEDISKSCRRERDLCRAATTNLIEVAQSGDQ